MDASDLTPLVKMKNVPNMDLNRALKAYALSLKIC